jgi:hypothetical protein
VDVIRGGCRSGVAGTRFNFGARQQWTDVLAIAFSHGHDRVPDGDELAAAEVASAASAAHGERDLIRGATFVSRSSQHLARHREQHGIVIEPAARRTSQLAHGIAKQRERLGRHLEAPHPRARHTRVRPFRRVAGALVGHELFELTEGLSPGHSQPIPFGFGDGHPGQLAYRAPADFTRVERASELGQAFEGFRHTELFLGGARLVPEHAFDIFGEAAMTQVDAHRRSKGTHQPASFFGVGCGPLASQSGESRMRLDPLTLSGQ